MRQGIKEKKWWMIVAVVVGLLIVFEVIQFQRNVIHTYNTITLDKRPIKMNLDSGIDMEVESHEFRYTDKEMKLKKKNVYLEIYPFAESQGWCARVKMVGGTWAVIDQNGTELVGGLEYINPLPCVTDRISATRDGHAVLFKFSRENEEIVKVKEYFEYSEISAIYYGEFAIVQGHNGLYGAVSWNGDVIIPAEYVEITWSRFPLDENPYVSMTIFKLQNTDGTYNSIAWTP